MFSFRVILDHLALTGNLEFLEELDFLEKLYGKESSVLIIYWEVLILLLSHYINFRGCKALLEKQDCQDLKEELESL